MSPVRSPRVHLTVSKRRAKSFVVYNFPGLETRQTLCLKKKKEKKVNCLKSLVPDRNNKQGLGTTGEGEQKKKKSKFWLCFPIETIKWCLVVLGGWLETLLLALCSFSGFCFKASARAANNKNHPLLILLYLQLSSSVKQQTHGHAPGALLCSVTAAIRSFSGFVWCLPWIAAPRSVSLLAHQAPINAPSVGLVWIPKVTVSTSLFFLN